MKLINISKLRYENGTLSSFNNSCHFIHYGISKFQIMLHRGARLNTRFFKYRWIDKWEELYRWRGDSPDRIDRLEKLLGI